MSILVIIAGFIGLLYVVIDALKDRPGALAIVMFFILAPTLAWAIFGAVQSARRPQRHHETRQSDVIESDYHVIQPTPPRAQLPAPRYVDVPTYHTNGQAQPLAAEIVLRSNDADGQSLEVPYRYLLRFAKCATPKRDEWTGKPQQF